MRPTTTWLLLFFALAPALLRADERLREAQQELRRRKLYFGRVDGRESDATAAAVRKFQELKGLERTGAADDETSQALGLRTGAAAPAAVRATECGAVIATYLEAQAKGDLEAIARCFGESVDFFDDGASDRAFLHEAHARAVHRWPARKLVLLQRIATENPERPGEVLVTARIRTDAGGPRPRVEDMTFRLRSEAGAWRIVAVKLLE